MSGTIADRPDPAAIVRFPREVAVRPLAPAGHRRLFAGLVVLAVVLCAGATLAMLGSGIWAISSDENARTIESYLFWQQPSLANLATAWPPLLTLLHTVGYAISPDLMLVPRIVSTVAGLLAVLGVMAIGWRLYRSPAVLVVLTLLACLLPERILLAATGLSEPLFFATIAGATLALLVFAETGGWVALLAGGAALLLGEATRYEAWMFAVFAGGWASVLLARRRMSPLQYVVFGCIVSAFPVFWFAAQWLVHGDMLHPWSLVSDRFTRLRGSELAVRLYGNALTQLMLAGAQSLTGLGIVLAGWLLLDRRAGDEVAGRRLRLYALWCAGPLFMIATTTMVSGGLPTHSWFRQATLSCLLLMPFTAAALLWCLRPVVAVLSRPRPAPARWVTGAAVAVALVASAGGIASLVLNETRRHTFPAEDRALGRWLGATLLATPDAPRPLIETASWHFANVIVAAGAPDRFLLDTGIDTAAPEPSRIAALLAAPDPAASEFGGAPVVVANEALKWRFRALAGYRELAVPGVTGWAVFMPAHR